MGRPLPTLVELLGLRNITHFWVKHQRGKMAGMKLTTPPMRPLSIPVEVYAKSLIDAAIAVDPEGAARAWFRLLMKLRGKSSYKYRREVTKLRKLINEA